MTLDISELVSKFEVKGQGHWELKCKKNSRIVEYSTNTFHQWKRIIIATCSCFCRTADSNLCHFIHKFNRDCKHSFICEISIQISQRPKI